MAETLSLWIIEDDELFRSSLEELISSAPDMCLGVSAASVEEALKLGMKTSVPEVILLDIGLPGMSGIEGFRR